ncbi:MAG: hypothetical protein EBZ23_12045, partial [Rhodobacteraceae bacterium]|nr:hypothetical protein [Paracoccaceae bacterium]
EYQHQLISNYVHARRALGSVLNQPWLFLDHNLTHNPFWLSLQSVIGTKREYSEINLFSAV